MNIKLLLLLLMTISQIHAYIFFGNVEKKTLPSLPFAASTFEDQIAPEQSSSPSAEGSEKSPLPYLSERRPLKTALLALSARTCRGEIANQEEKIKALGIIEKLESYNPTDAPSTSELLLGSWELVYSNTNLFRSSPFFMAARAVCKEGEEADRFNMFCDLHRQALAFTSIGKVKQIISKNKLISEFETNVALVPGLPVIVKGTIMSSADIETKDNNQITLYMDTVRIKPSTSNIPLLNKILDEFSGLPIRALGSSLESRIANYKNPRPIFRTNYVDTHMRISRDQDNNVFVYNRV